MVESEVAANFYVSKILKVVKVFSDSWTVLNGHPILHYAIWSSMSCSRKTWSHFHAVRIVSILPDTIAFISYFATEMEVG